LNSSILKDSRFYLLKAEPKFDIPLEDYLEER